MSFYINFQEGETFKFGLQITGLDDIQRVTVAFRNQHDVLFKQFSTEDSTIGDEGEGLYSVVFTDQMSLKKAGKGFWQFEIESTSKGVVKSKPPYRYEISEAIVLRSTETAVIPVDYNKTFTWDFAAEIPELGEDTEAFIAAYYASTGRKTVVLTAVANGATITHNMGGAVDAVFFGSDNNKNSTILYTYNDLNSILIQLPVGGDATFTGKVLLTKI